VTWFTANPILVQNAFKFSESGKRVSVALSALPNGVLLSVGDQGLGFSTEHITRVGAYMQFDRKMQEQQGLGLGLVIAKRLAELHGGALSIQSERGGATVVAVNDLTQEKRTTTTNATGDYLLTALPIGRPERYRVNRPTTLTTMLRSAAENTAKGFSPLYPRAAACIAEGLIPEPIHGRSHPLNRRNSQPTGNSVP
jgi:hypothetical protein